MSTLTGTDRHVAPKPAESALVGRVLGDFEVTAKLAQGGVGATYLAKQTLLGREAVIKVLLAGAQAEAQTQSRFLREARLASRVDHPYATQIFAFGAESDGLLWIAMELVRGESLAEMLKKSGPIPLARFAPFFDALCDCVDAVHDKGIVHRDVKPSNVMVTMRNGRMYPKLLDLGIATIIQKERSELSSDEAAFVASFEPIREPRSQETTAEMSRGRGAGSSGSGVRLPSTSSPSATATYQSAPTPAVHMASNASPSSTLTRIELAERGSITRDTDAVGSPNYMAPEQWLNSRDVNAQADIYSLGVLAWQCLTGTLPFLAKNTTEIAMAHLHSPVPPLPEGFPESLQQVLNRALAKKQGDRYEKAGDLGRAMMAVTAQTQRLLPSLPEVLRQEWVDAAPQPLAETMALFGAVRTAKEGFEIARRLTLLLPRFLGLLGLLGRQRLGPGDQTHEAALGTLVGALRNGRLEHHGWLDLLWHAVAPWAPQSERHPLPALVEFCATSGAEKTEAFKALESLELDSTPEGEDAALARYDELIGRLSHVLREASFLLRLTVGQATYEAGLFDSFSGVRRPVRAQVNARLPSALDGDLYLFDSNSTPLLRMHPLVQVLEPSPDESPEVFLFTGAGRHGARLVSAPREFERQDEGVWPWFDATWPRLESPAEQHEAQKKPPYRGLASFTASDAQDFFGREAEAEAVANRLRVKPFLAVVGPSGVGKSSFVQAGVAPLLSRDLTLVVVRPGNTPLATLLAKLKTLGVETEALNAAALEKDPSALATTLTAFALGRREKYLLVIDQFEELLTLCPSPKERETYAAALVSASSNPNGPVRVVVTLRDDFLIRAQGLEALKTHLSTGLHLLGTPGEPELVRILTEPLKRVGFAFEDPELPRQMVEEVMHQPGALALLSFSATRLWERRDQHFRRLTRQAYQSMGGVGGALAGHAEETLAAMPEDERALVREAFRHLVSSSGTRAVLSRAEALELLGGLAAGARVLDALIDARLLVTSEGAGGDDRVEIIHEALLSSWPRLVQWQRENAELARMRDNLRGAARQWQEQKRPRGMLWRDEVLAEYRLWRPKYPGALTQVEQAFAAASVNEFERGQRIRRGLLIAAFAVLSVGMVILVRANGRAEANAIEARENARVSAYRMTLMTAEQGRVAFLAGRPADALMLLDTAIDGGVDNAGIGYMHRKAARAVASERRSIELPASTTSISFNKNELAVSLSNSSLVFYDAQTLKERSSMSVPKGSFRVVRFSPDGSKMLGCSSDGTVSVWDASTNTRLDALQVSAMPLSFCASNTDGSFIVSGGADIKLRVLRFDGAALKLISTTTYEALLQTVRFNSTRSRFVATMAETMGPPPMTKRHPIEALQGKPVWLENTRGPVRSAVWSHDDRTIFTGGEATGVTAWDASTGKKKFDMPGHRGAVIGLAVSPDGKTLFSAGSDGTLRLWNPASGAALKTIQAHPGRITDVWQPKASNVVLTLGSEGAVNVWSLSGQLRKTLPSPPSGLLLGAPDTATDQFVSVSLDSTLRSFQLSATDFEREVPVAAETALFAISPDEKTLLTAVFDGPFTEHDLVAGSSSKELAAKLLEDRFFVFAPAELIATDRAGTIDLIDRQNQIVKSFKAHPGGEATVDVSPDGKRLLANGGYAEPIVIEIESGTSHSPSEKFKTATAFFSRKTGGSDVWFGSTTGDIVFWPATGALRKQTISRAMVMGLAESPDGQYLVAATYDQRLHVIRADTLEVTSTAASGITSSSIAFSPDSKLVVVGAPSGDVQVWSLSPFEKVDARKVGAKLYQLASLRTSAQFITLTPEGLLVWAF